MMNAVELFAGAGGLGMGVALAGFSSKAVLEWDRVACDTLRENGRRGHPLVKDWPVFEGDVRDFAFGTLEDRIDLVAGGPPCQPFSMGGKHRANEDERDMFPATVKIIRKLRPRAFIVENVRGLSRPSFKNYFEYIKLQLTYPELARRGTEDWLGHLRRLEKEKTLGRPRGLGYRVVARLVNAADYGVPQKRERVFIVGFRNDVRVEWSFPEETHSFDELLRDQCIGDGYWNRHAVAKSARPVAPAGLGKRLSDLETRLGFQPRRRPWLTVRDALQGLPDPTRKGDNGFFSNHRFQPGARPYPGHTGSPLDLPCKALKAGDHGVPGGENMLVLPDGACRYLTVREAARLQTFPDGYVIQGPWSEAMRQLGNAVPVQLAHVVAASVAEKLAEQEFDETARLISRLSRP